MINRGCNLIFFKKKLIKIFIIKNDIIETRVQWSTVFYIDTSIIEVLCHLDQWIMH